MWCIEDAAQSRVSSAISLRVGMLFLFDHPGKSLHGGGYVSLSHLKGCFKGLIFCPFRFRKLFPYVSKRHYHSPARIQETLQAKS